MRVCPCIKTLLSDDCFPMFYPYCRMKVGTYPHLTDREMFDALPLTDAWHDAQVLEVWDYLWHHPKTRVPDSWHETMVKFDREFRETL